MVPGTEMVAVKIPKYVLQQENEVIVVLRKRHGDITSAASPVPWLYFGIELHRHVHTVCR